MTEEELTALEEWANYTRARSFISRGALELVKVFRDICSERDALMAQNKELLNALKGLRALIIGECGATLYECIDGERADDAIEKAES